MPAHRAKTRRIQRKKTKSARVKPKLSRLLAIVIILIIFLLGLNIRQSLWPKFSNLTLVTRGVENIFVTSFDKKNNEITTVIIPNNTEAEVARALGVWKLGSVWELGANEGYSGKLLAETVTYNYNLPTVAWADEPARGLFQGNLKLNFKAIFTPYKTNLSILDRVKMAMFSAGVNNLEREEINLFENGVLKTAVLKDGTSGYIKRVNLPTGIVSIFADPDLVESQSRVLIKEASGKPYLADKVGAVIEAMGGKVTSVLRENKKSVNCVISGNQEKIVERISKIIMCEVGEVDLESNFDIEITIGEEFAKRF